MRRLRIEWFGVSKALEAARQAVEQCGHQAGSEDADLVIEDGSRPLPMRVNTNTRISLRMGVGPLTEYGLPALQLRSYDCNQRLLATLDLAQEPSGNGRRLQVNATCALAEWTAQQVSDFARDPECFSTTAHANAWPEKHLQELEGLAFLHRFNCTADQALLLASQVPTIERLQASLQAFAARPALNINGEVWTYRQLHAQALLIQQRLEPLLEGIEAPPVVGICLEKSPGLYASILAVMGCGAVYLPLATDHPPQRQQQMLDSAGARVLLDDGRHALRERFSSLDVSRVDPSSTDATHTLLKLRQDPQAPCLALFTSGTTGRPKGVLLSQNNLAHFAAWSGAFMDLNEHSRVLQFSPLSFDSSLIDIFPSLIAGAELIVPSDDQRRDPRQLIELIHRQRVSHAFLPPALLSILPLDRPIGLTHLLTGGDVCEPHVIEQLAGQCSFHNLYGPTEATVLVTQRTLLTTDTNRNLGRPIANSQVLILDDHQQPVDEQVMGELYIVGPGVGLGYMNASADSTSPFVELKLPGGERVQAYRSGDLAKWTKDGIELGGRKDQQVKIRGFRVEPLDIEHCLRSSRLFRQVAVIIEDDRRVLAFVAQPAPEATLDGLKQHAQQWLPDYMQPVVWTELPLMPYTRNGKVDRRALQEVAPLHPPSSNGHTPQTPLQAQLVALWSELLVIPAEGLSVDESFFNLGGHSILLSTLLLRLREQFERSIALNRFFEAPTIRTLALLLEDGVLPDASTGQAARDALRPLGMEMLPEERAGDPRKAIVTGANSFVGVHIVEALLAGGATQVACLVRELPGLTAMQRFIQALREFRLEHLDLSRVQVYAADISLPRLGLAHEAYDKLAQGYGLLVHNAARVNHVMDYAVLAKDNVDSVLDCLRLCETGSKKVFNFISTLSASSSIDAQGYVLEAPAAACPPLYIKNGYNLSKWVAERLLGRAVGQGAWVNIHRPGNISFHSHSGACQPQKNRLLLMLKGSLQLGRVPRLKMNFDLMPVDFFAKFVAFQSGHFDAGINVFHLHNPQPLSWDHYLEAFSRAGHVFEWVSVAQWQRDLRTVRPDNALFGVLGFYLDDLSEDINDTSMIRHDNARRGIERMGAHYPEKTALLLSKGCDYLKAIGFLRPIVEHVHENA